MLVPGFDRVYAVGDLVLVPHARFGPIRFPQWDAAIGTGEHAADVIAGVAGDYERLPYWWTDIGELRVAEVGVAEHVVGVAVSKADLHVGRDAAGDGRLRDGGRRPEAAARGAAARASECMIRRWRP